MNEIALVSKQIARAMLESLGKRDVDALSKLWADDAVQEMPFCPEGFPKKFEGKKELDRQYADLLKNFAEAEFPIKRISALEDPEWVMVEFDGFIKLKAGGGYNNVYVGLFHVQDGKIRLFREYFDPIVLQNAFDHKLKESLNLVLPERDS